MGLPALHLSTTPAFQFPVCLLAQAFAAGAETVEIAREKKLQPRYDEEREQE
jgi:hypothetical protein